MEKATDEKKWKVTITLDKDACPYLCSDDGCRHPDLAKDAHIAKYNWKPCELEGCPVEEFKLWWRDNIEEGRKRIMNHNSTNILTLLDKCFKGGKTQRKLYYNRLVEEWMQVWSDIADELPQDDTREERIILLQRSCEKGFAQIFTNDETQWKK